jgi:hypothetical protein
MHPIAQYELMQARVADRHRQADHTRLARAVTQARRGQQQRRASPRSDLAVRLFRALRGWQPSRRSAS